MTETLHWCAETSGGVQTGNCTVTENGGALHLTADLPAGTLKAEMCIRDRGRAVCTPAFGLPAKYIFHAVCPAWHGGRDLSGTHRL